jgi:hypothetical protein
MLGGDNACLIEPAALAKSASRSAQAFQRKPFNVRDEWLGNRTVAISDQPAAYQPSGNGIKPQAVWLSLAARGGCISKYFGEVTTKSSCGTGATAVRTASSNRSNSTSPIALSQVSERSVAKVFCFQIEAIAQIVSIERSRPFWLLMSYPRTRTSGPASHQM